MAPYMSVAKCADKVVVSAVADWIGARGAMGRYGCDDGIVVPRDGMRVAFPRDGELRMAARSLNERVEILEQKVGELQTLPDRVTGLESQILQLRGEMRDGFSAILARVQEGDEETRRYSRALHEEVLTKLHEGDEETRNQMRTLHEEVISRFALLQDLSAVASAKAEAPAKAKGRGRRKR